MKPEVTEAAETTESLPDFKTITVTLTFEGFKPFIFKFRRQSSLDVKKQKQEYYALTEAQQKEKAVEFRSGVLGSLLVDQPQDVIGFEYTGNAKEDFIRYFTDPENDELLTWVYNQYQDKLYPKELMSSLSE